MRYVKANRGRIPGDVDRIVSSGVSAGGALSTLLGASGDSPLYRPYLDAIGAADASDAIHAVGAWCPITDLEHADMAYEWAWGGSPLANGSLVDQTVSKDLAGAYADYVAGLRLRARGYGALTVRNLDDYLVGAHLEDSATRYLTALSGTDRASYLAAHTFLDWQGGRARFSWDDFVTHVGARKKDTPAFDAFDLSAGENNLFGTGTTAARHFTLYSLRHASGSTSARLDEDLPAKLHLMNPMHHLVDLVDKNDTVNNGRSRHWWLRVGTKDTDSSPMIVSDLHARLTDLSTKYYWDAGHGADQDPGDFVTWIAKVSGYRRA